jgi:chromosome segregation ATPase
MSDDNDWASPKSLAAANKIDELVAQIKSMADYIEQLRARCERAEAELDAVAKQWRTAFERYCDDLATVKHELEEARRERDKALASITTVWEPMSERDEAREEVNTYKAECIRLKGVCERTARERDEARRALEEKG